MKTFGLVIFLVAISVGQVSGIALQIPDFKKADSVAALYPNHSLNNLKILSDKLTQSLETEEEKFRAIYKWVCDNIEYDYPMHQENQRKREKLKSAEEREAWNKKISMRA